MRELGRLVHRDHQQPSDGANERREDDKENFVAAHQRAEELRSLQHRLADALPADGKPGRGKLGGQLGLRRHRAASLAAWR